jgi:crotonobetainyl-CoA:carnitine CoA-transferase CaiB-like acyl-CoA transferase
VRENQILEEHEDRASGKVRQPRPAARFDRTPSSIRTLAPMLGADNDAIVSELGYSIDDLARLKRSGILHTRVPRKES